MFRSGIATSLSAAMLITAVLGAGPAAASAHPEYQINIETRFVEIDRSFVNEIGVDFRGLDAAPGAPFAGGMAPGVLPLLQSSGQAAVLASPRVSVIPDQTATITAGGTLTVPAGIPGTAVTFDDFGIDVKITPQIRPDGTITLELNIARDGLDLGPTVPEIRTDRTAADVVLPNGETVVIGGLISDRLKSQAGQVPGLSRLPLLGALFRTKEQAKTETTLLVLITPTVVGGGGGSGGGGTVSAPPPPEPPKQTSYNPPLLGLKPGQIYISAGAGAIFQDMPNFNWLRLQSEPNQALLSEDTDTISEQDVIDGGIGLNQGLFGGAPRLAFSFRYTASEVESFQGFLSGQGSDLEIDFPDGGGATVPGANSNINNVDFNFFYEAMDFSVKLYEEIPTNIGKGLTVGGGLALRYGRSDAAVSFATNNFADQYTRRDDVENWSVGPVIGAYLSHDYGPVTAYGGAEVKALASVVDSRTTVDLDGGTLDNLDLSETRFTYDLNLTAGARFDVNTVMIDLQTSFGYGNNHPMIVYRQGNEAELEFEGARSWSARVSVIYKFD